MCFDDEARPPIDPTGSAVTTESLTLQAADGTQFAAVMANAEKPSGAGVVILPDIRGLHHYYEELAERFAERGHDSIAIDYFGRTAGVGHGAARADAFEWQPHIAATQADQIRQDAAAAVERLRSKGVKNIFTVGFCFGGSASWLQAANGLGLAGAIGFYGRPTGPTRDGSPSPIDRASEIAAPLLNLFGGADQGIPQTAVDEWDAALTAAGKTFTTKVYDGAPHSFFDRRCDEHREACDDAWQRMLAFIDANNK